MSKLAITNKTPIIRVQKIEPKHFQIKIEMPNSGLSYSCLCIRKPKGTKKLRLIVQDQHNRARVEVQKTRRRQKYCFTSFFPEILSAEAIRKKRRNIIWDIPQTFNASSIAKDKFRFFPDFYLHSGEFPGMSLMLSLGLLDIGDNNWILAGAFPARRILMFFDKIESGDVWIYNEISSEVKPIDENGNYLGFQTIANTSLPLSADSFALEFNGIIFRPKFP